MYLKNYSDGLHYEKAFYAVWAVCVLAYCSHYSYCSSMGLAIRDALGVSFLVFQRPSRIGEGCIFERPQTMLRKKHEPLFT